MSTCLDLQHWIGIRHVIIDTEHPLLTENSNQILKCLGGMRQCLLLLLSSRAILSSNQCDSITQIISDAIPLHNELDQEKDKPLKFTLDTLDSNSLSHITQFLSKSEIHLSFKNVCAKFAIIGLDEMQKVNIKIVEPTCIEYQYKFSGNFKLYKSLNMRIPKTVTTRTFFMRIIHENHMNPSNPVIYKAAINCDDDRMTRVVPVTDVTCVTMRDDRVTVHSIDTDKHYMICESIASVHYTHYEPTDNVLLYIKYYDIFDQKLYVKYLSFPRKTTIQRFIECISSKLILNCDNPHTKYEFTNLKCIFRDKLLFYIGNHHDDSLTALDLEGTDLLQDLNDIQHLCSIAFQLDPQKIVSKYSKLKNEVINAGEFWYDDVCEYIESRKGLTHVKVGPRKGFETILLHKKSAALVREHECIIDKRTTYGMLRKRLAKYYKMNALNIEIWKQNDRKLWDYGRKGKGQWDEVIGDLNELQFEIQPYNAKDFDSLIRCHDPITLNANTDTFEPRIKQLAMFNFVVITPNVLPKKRPMTIAFGKEWIAKELMQHILNKMIDIPIFGETFFEQVIEYIKTYEMEDKYENNDLLILQDLKPNRFAIMADVEGDVDSYYMNKRWEMPTSYSPVKYTDFEIHFLAKKDPLIAAYPKCLWIIFYEGSKRTTQRRSILEKDQSLGHAISQSVLSYSNVSWDTILNTSKFIIRKTGVSDINLDKTELEKHDIYDELEDKTTIHVYIPKKKVKKNQKNKKINKKQKIIISISLKINLIYIKKTLKKI
eukprot:981887_1